MLEQTIDQLRERGRGRVTVALPDGPEVVAVAKGGRVRLTIKGKAGKLAPGKAAEGGNPEPPTVS